MEALTELDRQVLALGLIALCGKPGLTEVAAANIEAVAHKVGVWEKVRPILTAAAREAADAAP